MRLLRYVAAGALLYGSLLGLTALLAQPGFRWTGVTAGTPVQDSSVRV
jgi:hypothetical protein